MGELKFDSKLFKLINSVKSLFKLGQLNLFSYVILVLVSIFIIGAFFVMLTLATVYPALSDGLFDGILNVYIGLNRCVWITPDAFAFLQWIAIFVLLMVGLLYVLIAFCVATPQGPLILFPPIITPVSFIFIDIAMIAAIGWLFLLDKVLLPASLVVNIFVISMLAIPFGILAYNFEFYKGTLIASRRFAEAALINISFLNGLGLLLGWLVYLAFVNGRYILTDDDPKELSANVFTVLLFAQGAYFVADITERWTRYVVTPYIAILVSVVSAIQLQEDNAKTCKRGFYVNDGGMIESTEMLSYNSTGFFDTEVDISFKRLNRVSTRMIMATSISYIASKLALSLYNGLLVQNSNDKGNVVKDKAVKKTCCWEDFASNEEAFPNFKIVKPVDVNDPDEKLLVA